MPSRDRLDRAVGSARDELSDSLDPTPPPFGQLRRRSTRRRSAALAAVAAIVVVAAIGVTRFDDEGEFVVAGSGDSPGEDGSNDDLLEPGASRPLAQSPLAGRSTMAAVWTGTEMLIWGGDGPEGQFDDGAAYDPRQDTWRLLPPSPLSPRNQPAAVWTGEEMLLWGGSSRDGDQRDGAAYNPTTGQWRSVAEAPFPGAGRPVGVWTGTEMVVLAGFNSRDAGIYDPVTDEWRLLPELPGQLQAPNPVGMWAGSRVFAVIQSASAEYATEVVSVAPGDKGWTTAPDLPAGQKVLAWTGTELAAAAGDEALVLTADGRWDHVATAPAGVLVGDTSTVWTGSSLLVWGGDSASFVDLEHGTWTVAPSLARRTQPAVVWADGVLLVWGGFPDEATGVMYRPATTAADRDPESTAVAGRRSQSESDAARDGVDDVLASLELSRRAELLTVVETDEGSWALARPPRGLSLGCEDQGTVCTAEYGELLLLGADQEVLRAFPMPGYPPSWIIITNTSVLVGHIGDGGLPDSTLIRIDRTTFDQDGIIFGDTYDDPDDLPSGWRLARPSERDALTGIVLVEAGNDEVATRAESWIGQVSVDVEAAISLLDG